MSDRQARAVTALDMAGRQKEISISEFFLKNRHLLGFDTPAKALVTAVKEAVDNALDACEEAGVLPEITVEVRGRFERSRVAVEDNGPGIVEGQIARIFGKLLYGSKFHKLSQSRGQQGMGISAAGMYGQLTVGKPLHIISRIEGEPLASELYVSIDTANNRPDIHKRKHIAWSRPHGTRVEMEIEGVNQGGPHSVEAYLKLTALANPHVSIIYKGPRGKELFFARACDELPPRPKEIKPHPGGVELGRLIQMLSGAKSRSLLQFMVDEFSCIGEKTARKIIQIAGKPLSERSYPAHIAHAQANALHRALQKVRVQTPRPDCLVPIGEARLLEGLRKELPAEFYTAATRPPASYRGNPFQVEVAIAFAGPGEAEIDVDEASGRMRKKQPEELDPEQRLIAHKDEPVRLLRFANRVPLLYQQSSCAIAKSVLQTNWRAYGLHQPKGALPIAPMAILVHVASVWVPYTSEAKEAIEPYPELVREIKLRLQQCARRLSHFLQRERALQHEYQQRAYIEKYLPHIGVALQEILGLDDGTRDGVVARLNDVLHANRAAKRRTS